ncbi:MAG: hypothetical protein CMJ89_13955 [Planctomycetes bacterium]|jgi:hypothetical protein|nr:hypothetical protein [Planctomycetota bacterium]
MGIKRLTMRALIAVGVLLVADQIAFYTVLRDGLFFGRPVAPFDPPLFSPAQMEGLARIERALATGDPDPKKLRFDAELGWHNLPGGGFGEFRYDWAGCRIGARPLSRTKEPGVRRLVAVGCSMTHGDEVKATETWCAQLDEARSDLEVANLGVSAYGIDQALLRLRRDGLPLQPDVVCLGLLPGAVLRLTSLYRPALRHWSRDVAFKPRFRLDASDELELVPNPARTLADIPRLIRDQRAFLEAFSEHDHWLRRARSAYAPRGTHWMHALFATRVGLSLYEAGGRDTQACFKNPAHGIYRLLKAVVLETRAVASEAEAEFLFLILPGRAVLSVGSYWDGFVQELRSEGVEVLDFSEILRGAPPDRLFAPLGHYGPEFSRIVAETLAEHLR